MAFKEEDIKANRDYFAAKLRAERQKADVARKVKGEPNAPDFVLIDTRHREAFESGHIPGAMNVPLSELKGAMASLPKDRELVLYCWVQT